MIKLDLSPDEGRQYLAMLDLTHGIANVVGLHDLKVLAAKALVKFQDAVDAHNASAATAEQPAAPAAPKRKKRTD